MQTEEQNLKEALDAGNMQAQDEVLKAAAEQNAGAAVAEDEAVATEDTQAEEGGAAAAAEAEQDPAVQMASMRAQLDILAKQAQADRDRMMRAVAEADNARKRAEADVERERKFALEKFVKAIIPVYDSLDQALTLSDRNDPATKATLDGVESTIKLMLKELSPFGVECINPAGAPFDPNQHQAISVAPSAEVPANHVLAVMQKGFVLNGRVVRPAMVVVSKAAEGQAEAEKAQGSESRTINIEA